MPNVHVPDAFRQTLDRIAAMSDADLKKVSDALTRLKPHLKPEIIAKSIAAASDIPDLGDIAQTLTSLIISRFRADVPLERFVRDVAASATKKDPTVMEERLKSLLSIDALVVSARAFDVQHEYEKVFRSARIISDLRPVFNATGTEATAAMIVHNLTVAFFQDGEFKEVMFALDDADLAALKKVLERAEIKTNTLEKVIGKAGLTYFESKDQGGT